MKHLALIAFYVGIPASLANAQAQAQAPAAPPRVERPVRDDVDVYLEIKAREFEKSDAAAQSLGKQNAVQGILALLEAKRPFEGADVRGKDSAQKEGVRRALTRTVAYQLAATGFGPEDIAGMINDGLDPLGAATRTLTGTPSIEEVLTLSPVSAIAKVSSNVPTNGDQTLRTVVFAVARKIRGDVGSQVSVQLQMPAPLSNAQPGQQFLLFLSDSLAKFRQAAGRRGEGSVGLVALPYEVEGTALVPVSPGQGPGQSTVARVDQFIVAHPKTFNAK